jgi:hypothetical protein
MSRRCCGTECCCVQIICKIIDIDAAEAVVRSSFVTVALSREIGSREKEINLIWFEATRGGTRGGKGWFVQQTAAARVASNAPQCLPREPQ